jgi:tetratricopeptide (TPR) repeat protein
MIPVCPPSYDYILPPIVVVPDPGYYDPGYDPDPPPVGFGPSMVPFAMPDPGFGVAGPLPPRDMIERWQARPEKPARRGDPERSIELVTIGDRLFRAGNTRRAAERYEQAVRADPNAAAPHIGLAQLAVVRGEYAEAAQHVREALTAQPGWLIHAPDISATYLEPADFHASIARLESHLQAHPTDRDAWLVLGAQWYLSGQTGRAADVFLRLTDRKADATLEAFLDASASKNQEE